MRNVLARPGLQDAAANSRRALDLAAAALRAGDVGGAESALRQGLLPDPNNPELLGRLAEIAFDDGRVEEAVGLVRRALLTEPDPRRRLAMIRQVHDHAGPAATLAEIDRLPAPMREAVEIRALEASALGRLGMHDREIALYEELVRSAPANVEAWRNLGEALKTAGRREEAVAALRQAIRLRPTFGKAWFALANSKSFRFGDSDVAAMRKALKRKLATDDSVHLNFALGSALEERRAFRQSFAHYAEGNRLLASGFTPQQLDVTPFVDAAIAGFRQELFEQRSDQGIADPAPIFVVGLPRSGSTLIEQILASHSMIEGTSELPVLPQLWQRLVRQAGSSAQDMFALASTIDLAEFGREYLDRTRAYRLTDRPYFVDKMPQNWMFVGLIRLALPNAKIIDARRHPMACGFSNFKQFFENGMRFSYTLESIGRFYAAYLRQMEHFDRVLPGFVHHVLNERLIDDPEAEVRRMLDFIGVPFEPSCLEFHNTRRAVSTASAEQVRRPLNREGVDRWRSYEPWLGPLRAALGDAIDSWDKVPA
jgi:tetratricopeptide (TPR) repeat protein